MVAIHQGRKLAPSNRPEEFHQRQRKLSRRAGGLRRRRSLRELGPQAPAHGSGMGVRGSRRTRRETICVGRKVQTEWKVDGEYLSGTFPLSRHRQRWVRWTGARGGIRSEWIWTVRHGGKCLAMELGLVSA